MDSCGTLSVRILAGPVLKPLEEATVAVTQRTPCGRLTVLSVQSTDPKGAIVPVSVPLPVSGAVALCDVWADHAAYKMHVAETFPVPCGESACLELTLDPK